MFFNYVVNIIIYILYFYSFLNKEGFWGLVVIQVPGPGSRVPGPGPGPGPGPKFWYHFKSSHIKFNRDSEFATNPTIDLLL